MFCHKGQVHCSWGAVPSAQPIAGRRETWPCEARFWNEITTKQRVNHWILIIMHSRSLSGACLQLSFQGYVDTIRWFAKSSSRSLLVSKWQCWCHLVTWSGLPLYPSYQHRLHQQQPQTPADTPCQISHSFRAFELPLVGRSETSPSLQVDSGWFRCCDSLCLWNNPSLIYLMW